MKKLLLFTLLFASINLFCQNKKKEILLIGTFHFNNPGADIVKTNSFDVMSKNSQKELEKITEKIKKYNPKKIFVEWEYDQQSKLDSLYNLYLNDNYFDYVKEKHPKNNFYLQNEIFQLAFKTAKKCNLKKVYGIDYPYTTFPFDSLLNSIEKAKQETLKNEILKRIEEFEKLENENLKKSNLTKLIINKNTEDYRKTDLQSYISLLNKAGQNTDFSGAFLVSEWFKRNLYMYSLVQKITESADDKVMILLGASHIALFKQYIELDENFKSIELIEILK